VALAIALGIVLRLAALPLPGAADLPAWKTWSYNAAVARTSLLYGTGARAGDRLEDHVLKYEAYESMVDYPPLVLYELAPVGWLFGWLTDGRFRDSVLFTVLIKAAPVVFEAAFTALLFAALRRTAGPPAARWAVMAYWLNPAALLSASVGGYLDALFVLPAAGSLVAATSGWPAVAGGLITASALTKPQGLFVVPAVLIGLWNAGDPAQRSRRLVHAAVGAAAVSILVVGPVVVAGAWWNLVYALGSQAAEVEITMEGYNFWWIAGHFLWTAYAWQRGLSAWSVFTGPVARVPFVRAAVHGLPYLRVIGTVMAAAGILWGAWTGRRARELWHVAAVGAFSVHAFAVLGAQVHQNHLFAAMPLLVIASAERRRFVPILVGVTAFISLSLLFVLPVGPDGPFVLSRTWTFLDTTLLLAVFNCLLFVWHAKILGEESRRALAC